MSYLAGAVDIGHTAAPESANFLVLFVRSEDAHAADGDFPERLRQVRAVGDSPRCLVLAAVELRIIRK